MLAMSTSWRAVRVGCDFEAHEVGHIANRLHFLVGKMLLEAACPGIKNAARRHDLDPVDTGGGQLTNDLLAFLRTGADRGIEVGFVERAGKLGRKTRRRIRMAADNRQGLPGNLDPRPRKPPFGNSVSNGNHGTRVAAEVADGREAALRHFQRMGQPNGCVIRNRTFLGIVAVPGLPTRNRQVHVNGRSCLRR